MSDDKKISNIKPNIDWNKAESNVQKPDKKSPNTIFEDSVKNTPVQENEITLLPQENTQEPQEININGIIEDFKQGKTGDCYLLAPLMTMQYNPTTAKILKDNIKKNEDGSIQVRFIGAERLKQIAQGKKKECLITGNYTITQKEFQEARNSGKYSTGDDDVLCYELAFEKYRKEVHENDKLHNLSPRAYYSGVFTGESEDKILHSGMPLDVFFVLTGKSGLGITDKPNVPKMPLETGESINGTRIRCTYTKDLATMLDKIKSNPQKYVVTADILLSDGKTNHAVMIQEIQDDYIIFINPWDAKRPKISYREDFIKYTTSFSVLDVTSQVTEIPEPTKLESKLYELKRKASKFIRYNILNEQKLDIRKE